MSQSPRRPTNCSFCSLLCEVPETLVAPHTLAGFCSKRADQLSSLPERLKQALGHDESLGESSADRARQLISKASDILVTGRIRCVESARSAIEFAQRCDALVDPWESDAALASIESLQRVGGYSVSLAESRDRSDLWIVVGDDRLLEQFPRLPFALNPDRKLPLLLLGRWSDASIDRWQQAGFDVLSIQLELEGLPKYLSQLTRLGAEHCDSQAGGWVLDSKYTTILYSPHALPVRYPDLWIDLLSRWVLHRNESTRVATLSWNSLQTTFHQTSTWLTGFPGWIRFQGGNSTYDPRRNRAKDWCMHRATHQDGGTGALLIWIDDSMGELPDEIHELTMPKVLIGPNKPTRAKPQDYWLASGLGGVTHPINTFRGDQTILARIPSEGSLRIPSPSDWLRRIKP